MWAIWQLAEERETLFPRQETTRPVSLRGKMGRRGMVSIVMPDKEEEEVEEEEEERDC